MSIRQKQSLILHHCLKKFEPFIKALPDEYRQLIFIFSRVNRVDESYKHTGLDYNVFVARKKKLETWFSLIDEYLSNKDEIEEELKEVLTNKSFARFTFLISHLLHNSTVLSRELGISASGLRSYTTMLFRKKVTGESTKRVMQMMKSILYDWLR
jgi:hypothetical protein